MNQEDTQTARGNRGKAGWLWLQDGLTRLRTRGGQIWSWWFDGNLFDSSTSQLTKEALLGWATAAVTYGLATQLSGGLVALIMLLLTLFSAVGATSRSMRLLHRLSLWWSTRGYQA